jgi:hypothetical protein
LCEEYFVVILPVALTNSTTAKQQLESSTKCSTAKHHTVRAVLIFTGLGEHYFATLPSLQKKKRKSKNAHNILVWKSEGKRPLGRPVHTWDDNIKMDLRKIW